MSPKCYHCDEVIPKGIHLNVVIHNISQPMCCHGCQSVAELIVSNGLTDYYRYRTTSAQTAEPLVPEQLLQKKLLDDEQLQEEFIFRDDKQKESILTIEGINCAACAWLIEKQISQIKGIIKISVNATAQRASVRWVDAEISLSDILIAIEQLGYHALPYKSNTAEALNRKQSKSFIKRLGISGILMMQVMMIAVGLYFGGYSDMTSHNLLYLRWVSLALTLPIVVYGAFPFYKGAVTAIKAQRLSMDVPVSIAIILAFCASVWATYSRQGEVYFESVSMFTFLLLIGKFLEFRARSRASEISSNLLKMMPLTATKLEEGKEVLIAAKHCQPLDIVLIKPGELVPADGVVIDGKSQINEAMLSGEQLPITKNQSDNVYAGTINGDGHLTIEVTKASEQSFLSQLIRLSESAQAYKPKLAKLSDKIAQYFVAVILLTSMLTALYWYQEAPENAFWITLSVLVATCPCALSLATPAALTCATTRLNKAGVMIKSGHVLETLPKVNCFAFDKTGTLTSGQFELINIHNYAPEASDETWLKIAAALESYSEHPIAKAFIPYRHHQDKLADITVESGYGVFGKINNKHYAIGKIDWFKDSLDTLSLLAETPELTRAQCILVSNVFANTATGEQVNEAPKILAAFYLEDNVRDDANTLVRSLSEGAIPTYMLSGDNETGCANVQKQLALSYVYSGLSAQQKLAKINELQSTQVVAMVGDGINDSPVLSAAHLSIAMGCGTDIAKTGADVILLNNKLSSIQTLKHIALSTKRIIWQNYFWAFGYNALVLPLAVMGYITPYFAVIGMSVSSILVITNSLRLLKK